MVQGSLLKCSLAVGGLDRESELCGHHIHSSSILYIHLLHHQVCLVLFSSKCWNSLLAGLLISVAPFLSSYALIPP